MSDDSFSDDLPLNALLHEDASVYEDDDGIILDAEVEAEVLTSLNNSSRSESPLKDSNRSKRSSTIKDSSSALCIRIVRLSRLKIRVIVTRDPLVDALFFYYCDLDESSFSHLKTAQGLLFDFSQFSSKFEELLRRCHRDPSIHGEFHLISERSQRAELRFVHITDYNKGTLLCLSLTRGTGHDTILAQFLAFRLSSSIKKFHHHRAAFEESQREYKSQLNFYEESIENLKLKESNLIDELNQSKKAHISEISRKNLEISRLEGFIRELEAKNVEILAKFSSSETDLTAQISKLSNQVEISTQSKLQLEKERARLEGQNQSLINDIHESQSKIASLSEENHRLSSTNQALINQIEELKSTSSHQLLTQSDLIDKNKQNDEEIISLKQALEEANQRLVDYRDGLDRARHGRREAQNVVEELKVEVEELTSRLDEVQACLISEKTRGERLGEELSQSKLRERQLKSEVEKSQSIIDFYSHELTKTEKQTVPVVSARQNVVVEPTEVSMEPKYNFAFRSRELLEKSLSYKPRGKGSSLS
ncbi:hypothetical protein RCL1_003993 [Eukaryota sp. TZLM3-RCL]